MYPLRCVMGGMDQAVPFALHCRWYKAECTYYTCIRVQELCENRGGRPGLPVLMSLTVSVDVKQQ